MKKKSLIIVVMLVALSALLLGAKALDYDWHRDNPANMDCLWDLYFDQKRYPKLKCLYYDDGHAIFENSLGQQIHVHGSFLMWEND